MTDEPTKTKTKTIRLLSAPMIHTPGVLAWAQNGYRFKEDRANLRRVFVDGFGLHPKFVDSLLKGELETRVVGDVVEVDVPHGLTAWRRVE